MTTVVVNNFVDLQTQIQTPGVLIIEISKDIEFTNEIVGIDGIKILKPVCGLDGVNLIAALNTRLLRIGINQKLVLKNVHLVGNGRTNVLGAGIFNSGGIVDMRNNSSISVRWFDYTRWFDGK